MNVGFEIWELKNLFKKKNGFEICNHTLLLYVL